MSVTDLSALPEERVSFVEQQHRLALLGRVENAGEVLLRLADPLRDHARQVDDEQIDAQLVGEHLGRERLASARRSGEKQTNAARTGAPVEESPVVEDARLMH